MDPNHWVYAAEGNQNIVLRYTGQDQSYVGHVLRLQKDKAVDARFQPAFVHDVIGALLGHDYIVPLTCVPVTLTFLKSIETKITHDRPDHRRARTIDLNQSWACLAPDLTFQSALTVEIKPKWGYKPTWSSLTKPWMSEKYKHVKATTCRFCMHSWYKHSRSDLEYCPLDLYSMEPARMNRALKALERESALHDKMQIKQQEVQNLEENQVIEMIIAILCQEPLLPRLKTLQRDLDQLTIEGIHSIYATKSSSLLPMYDIDVWRKVVQCFKRRDMSMILSDAIDPALECQYLYEHVLSAVLKDCSIFISIIRDTVDRCDDNFQGCKIQLDNGEAYHYTVKVVDTDLKNMSKIPYWYDLDQRIVEHATRHHTTKVCHE
ncbi:inositol-pentakisphosphate 2-kinase [Zychaea mexicana]|uniref:inositol-pentakisphosphate 2-kinase n=1 Tax=Zychaea mexicana TaxID=64656 RepID=UPI0022FE7B55|nr:inositol-pentakisphosphate 2-kinase [Zychaea mexicana]KAI9493947.1 inositol-pentakisphosphate 2-kinase [Zychaea mexicana]